MSAVAVGTLIEWGEINRRTFPWRATRDPWLVLVSEVMLQQTQADRVVARYDEFRRRYPTVASCAAADRADVVRSWQGLGYYRRAVGLHEAARVIVDRHGSVVPSDLGALLALPGVGAYTARAVLAFAFERDVAPVDTNIARILARQLRRCLTPLQVQEIADSLVPSGEGWRWNQTLFDLGATVCTKREPGCARCPVADTCGWAGDGPDPASGSAGTSRRQARFDGSDRQGRGRLVAALCDTSVSTLELAAVMGWPDDEERARSVAESMAADGVVSIDDDVVFLAM